MSTDDHTRLLFRRGPDMRGRCSALVEVCALSMNHMIHSFLETPDMFLCELCSEYSGDDTEVTENLLDVNHTHKMSFQIITGILH